MKKRIAITGSSGFIASAIIKQLKDVEILKITRGDYYKVDFESKLKAFNPQIIIHTGAYGNHAKQRDDLETFEANIVKTFMLLQTTKDIPYEAFINFGSSSEYGNKSMPMREEDVLEPLTMYGCTKAASTMLARAFAIKYDKPIVTVRPFSVYGEGEAEHRFIPTVIRSIIHDEVLSLDEEGVHDWIHISDFVAGVLKVIDNAKTLQGQAVNIGTGKQYTNKDIAQMLIALTFKETKTQKVYNTRAGDSRVWVANINTMKLLGWRPKIEILEGLARCFTYYRKLYGLN